MNDRSMFGMVAVFLSMAVAVASAEIKVAVDHNDTDHSTAEFKFKEVPSPAKENAAIAAKFKIVDGDKDDNSGDLEVLHDGKLPTEEDAPAANFFFNAGTEGGRILIDLGSTIDVKQFNTYSWHTDTRAPQVYSLYGSDGTVAGFNSAPGKDIDPEKVGWKLITKIDTRPKTGEPGGQYGVSISDSTGSIGKYRYLLVATTRTESDDDFGNTFFSEINVIDARELIGEPAKPGDKPNVKWVEIEGGKFTATIDTTETPDLTDWAQKELAPTVAEWYPQLVKMLPSPEYSPPTHFSITFCAEKPGEKPWFAYTSGTHVNCWRPFIKRALNGESKGAIIHEMVHVVQQYNSGGRIHNPGWLVEGIPDYIRWYEYEPKSNGAAISKRGFPRANYDGSYRISANFLNWTVQKYDKHLIAELNAAMRQGNYSEDLWKKLTGKTVEDLGTEWKDELGKSLGATTQAVGT